MFVQVPSPLFKSRLTWILIACAVLILTDGLVVEVGVNSQGRCTGPFWFVFVFSRTLQVLYRLVLFISATPCYLTFSPVVQDVLFWSLSNLLVVFPFV